VPLFSCPSLGGSAPESRQISPSSDYASQTNSFEVSHGNFRTSYVSTVLISRLPVGLTNIAKDSNRDGRLQAGIHTSLVWYPCGHRDSSAHVRLGLLRHGVLCFFRFRIGAHSFVYITVSPLSSFSDRIPGVCKYSGPEGGSLHSHSPIVDAVRTCLRSVGA